MDRLTEIKATAILFGLMWFISIPIAVVSGITMIEIALEASARTFPWQNFWEALTAFEAFRIFLCGFFLVYGGFWGSKGLSLEMQGDGVLSLIMSQRKVRYEDQ